ncbi:hypothetical protein PKF05_09105, partial [Fusobacterium simiae]|uniref:hypothetical protein n=1 Tax=Fusobacterium simiae TaxID=855 RepID=UPI0023510102
MKKNKKKQSICILYTNSYEKEFLQLSQMTDKYEIFYQFIGSEEELNFIIKKNKEKEILYLTPSTNLLKKFSELKSYSEFLENNMKAIYIKEKLNIFLKKSLIEDFIRRVFDIIMSIILLLLSLPICVITMILIKADIG